MGLGSLFRKPLESLAVFALHGEGNPEATSLGRLVARHAAHTWSAATGLTVHPLLFFFAQDANGRATNELLNPHLDEKSALQLAEPVSAGHVLWGEIDSGATLRLNVRFSPPPKTRAPVEFSAEAAPDALGGLLDDLVEWMIQVSERADAAAWSRVREIPTMVLLKSLQIQEDRDLMRASGASPSQVLQSTGQAFLHALGEHDHHPLLLDGLHGLCAEAQGDDENQVALSLLEDACVMIPENRFLPGLRAVMVERLSAEAWDALDAWSRSVEAFPDYHHGWTSMARIRFEGMARNPDRRTPENIEETIRILRITLALDDNQAYPHFILGNLTEDIEERVEHWLRTVDLVPDDEIGKKARELIEANGEEVLSPPRILERYKEGMTLLQSGDHERALASFQKATLCRPWVAAACDIPQPQYVEMFAAVWNNMGICHVTLGRRDEAMRCYDRALELDPRHVSARQNKERLSG